jgi:hypothetical protein
MEKQKKTNGNINNNDNYNKNRTEDEGWSRLWAQENVPGMLYLSIAILSGALCRVAHDNTVV